MECTEDAHCLDPALPVCDLDTNTCVECTEDDTSACPQGYTCDPDLDACVPPDLPGDQCINNDACDPSLGCGGGQCLRCHSNGGYCTECTTDADCPGIWLCNEELSTCVFCVEDTDCSGDDVCHGYGDCGPTCAGDADCSYDGFVCDLVAERCVPAPV